VANQHRCDASRQQPSCLASTRRNTHPAVAVQSFMLLIRPAELTAGVLGAPVAIPAPTGAAAAQASRSPVA
jgi:hypothetical protein